MPADVGILATPLGAPLKRLAPLPATGEPPLHLTAPRPITHQGATVTTFSHQMFKYGGWVFDINGASRLLEEHPRTVVQTPVDDWATAYHLHLLRPGYDGPSWCPIFGPDQSHFSVERAMRTDLNRPVIIATLEFDSGPARLLIDGVHRMFRAMVEGRPTLPAHVLSIAETTAIRRH